MPSDPIVFSYGSLDYGSATKSYVLELTVQEQSVSIENNTSQVSYTLKLISGSNNRFSLHHIGAAVWLGGALVGYRDRNTSAQLSLGYNSSIILLSDTVTVSHNADGTCTMPVAFSIDIENNPYTPGPLAVTDQWMSLSVIPRKSSIGATNALIGAVSTVAVTKQAESFQHSIAYSFGALSGYITANGGISATEAVFSGSVIPFTVPESFYSQLPNAASGQCTLTVNTYSGAALIGTDSCSFTVTANADICAPDIAWEITDINETTKALTGDDKTLIRYFSTARCEIRVAAKNSATLSIAQIGGTQVALSGAGYGFLDIPGIATATVSCGGTDSRGYYTGAVMTAPMVPYSKLTDHIVPKWTNVATGEAKLQISGMFYDGSFGAVDNALHVQYRPTGEHEYINVDDIAIAGGWYAVDIPLTGLDYQQEYSYEVRIWDALMTVEKSVTLRKGQPVFHWGEEDFQFCVPVGMNDRSIKQVHSVNGLCCGGVRFDTSTIAYLSVQERTLMLFGLAGNGGGHALYLVVLDSPGALSQCIKLSGTLDVHFSLEQEGVLKVVSPLTWSYGWYIKNSDYADLISQ